MINTVLLTLLVIVVVVFSAVFAGAETGFYRLSNLRLRLGAERRRFLHLILAESMRDSEGLLLTILIGNNLTHYVTASFFTIIFLRLVNTEHAAELFATAAATPILFVFGEMIPKNIFYYRSDSLMPYVSPILLALQKAFRWCGIAGLLRLFSIGVGRLCGSWTLSRQGVTPVYSSHIDAIVRETQEEAFLSPVQTGIIKRLTKISTVNIRYVMTPMSRVEAVELNTNKSELTEILKHTQHTRLPVYDGGPLRVIGFINIYECLSCGEDFRDLRRFLHTIMELGPRTLICEAMNTMRDESQKIVLVTHRGSRTGRRFLGIVTMKDLVEEVLGELAEW